MADPRQPMAAMPYTIFQALLFARSRSVAMSGIRPTYQNSSETVP